MTTRLASVFAIATAITAATTANADEDVVRVRLDYESPPACPDADRFFEAITQRAPRARLANSDEEGRELVVRLRQTTRGYEGSVEGRTVRASSCTEVATALAVIAAIVIDPLQESAPDAGSPPPPAPPAPPTEPSPAEIPPIEPDARREAPPRAKWLLSAGAGGGIVGGRAPDVLLSVPVFVEIARTTASFVEPAVRLRFERTSVSSVRREGGGASFVVTSGAADLCPLALRTGVLRFQTCLRTEVGVISAAGLDVSPSRSNSRPWFAMGPAGRARLEISGPVFVELEAALLVAAVRDRFYVEPFAAVYRPPALGATTALAIGVTFW